MTGGIGRRARKGGTISVGRIGRNGGMGRTGKPRLGCLFEVVVVPAGTHDLFVRVETNARLRHSRFGIGTLSQMLSKRCS
jgi:hypothetical protein